MRRDAGEENGVCIDQPFGLSNELHYKRAFGIIGIISPSVKRE